MKKKIIEIIKTLIDMLHGFAVIVGIGTILNWIT